MVSPTRTGAFIDQSFMARKASAVPSLMPSRTHDSPVAMAKTPGSGRICRPDLVALAGSAAVSREL
jgi:hypothetical protein